MSDAATHAASARSKGHQPLLTAELDALARSHNRHDGELRKAVAQYLKDALAEGRREAEGTLLRDRNGHRCAARLCDLQDEVIRALYHFVTTHLYASENPSEAERIAVVATGGYGRGLLAPGSDIDLLFLLPYKQTAWGESVAEAMLYALWDMGLKVGHASRSVSECIRQAKADMTIRTGLLEARYLLGDHALFDELARRFDREVMQGTAAEFVAAKLAEREERVRKVGASRYLVEPNVKDGKGGLRDLHTLFWIAKYVYRVADPEELIKHGVFDQREYKLFRRSEDFLWSVRCNMHFVAGRAEERLSFDLQREIAVRLGYTEHPGAQDVERFMKHYFLIAKDVGDLTAIMCADLEDRQAKPAPMLNRFVARLRPRQRAVRNIGDFAIDKNRITLGDPDAFARDPVNLIRMFHVAQTHELAFHPDIMRAASRSLKLIDKSLRENPEANRLFLEILTGRESEIVLRRMNEPGVLGRFIPDFGRVVSMMQFNMYHHYTVDEHLLRCIGVLASIERGDNEDRALAQQLMKTIQPENRTLLYLALFLHDIAKGRVEDHSIAGARIARRLGPRFGLAPAATETLAWLVEQHLVMSMVAQSRDLSDRRTIETFASVVQSLERLKLLTILTVADISAVGPGVFNSWKAQLLKTLYYETEPVLTGGFSEVDRAKRVAMAHDEFRAAMTEWPAEKIDAYLPRHYPAYWLKVDLPHKVRHARLLDQAKASGKSLATAAIFEPARGVTELTVLAPDHPRLLSTIAGACAVAGANIVDAQIYTTTDGFAVDTISVSREFEHDEDEERRALRIAQTIEQVLSGEVRLPEIVARRSSVRPRLKAFAVEPSVAINNQWSNRYTVIEITGLDRPGFLYELTATLSRLNLNIASAHVATFGERAVDVFYVTDLMGAKIEAPQRQAAIKSALLSLLQTRRSESGQKVAAAE